MIPSNDHLRHRSLNSFRRLDDLVLRETDPDAWNSTILVEALGILKRWQAIDKLGPEETTRVLVDLYRLAYRSSVFRAPREYFFWLVAIWLNVEAHVGPDALLYQEDYLGPLWGRRDAIWEKHGCRRKTSRSSPGSKNART